MTWKFFIGHNGIWSNTHLGCLWARRYRSKSMRPSMESQPPLRRPIPRSGYAGNGFIRGVGGCERKPNNMASFSAL
eukprot:3074563-Pyramimonas_sp.AAC.1